MEILNNIWIALSTENETFMKILSIPLIMIEAYISLLLFTTFLKIEYTKKQRNLYIFGVSIIGLISMNIIPAPINTIINYIFLFFLIFILFKQSKIKTLLSLIIPFSMFSIIGLFILNPLLKILKIESTFLNTVPLYKVTYLCILYAFILIILFVIKIKDKNFNLYNNANIEHNPIVIINLALGIFTLIIQLIIAVCYTNFLPIYITFLSCISLIAYFLISFYSLSHAIKLQKTSIDLENSENYNKTLSFLYDNVKGFKHDFDDIVNMIGGYIKTNDIDGLREYYKDLEKDNKKIKNIATLNPSLINNPGIYNLLVSKYKKATSLDVKIHLEYFFDFEKLHMPIYQFSRMLGILLDNAIEAASTSQEKQIEITFRDSSRNNTQIIVVKNSYSNKNIDTKKIFEKGVSEKKEHMGMGLWEVKQIINQNNNINLITSADEKYFKQQLEIYY